MDTLHNNPPAPAEIFADRIDRYRDALNALGPVTEANAQTYRDELGIGVSLKGEIEAQHKIEKAPHLEAGRKVDGTYKPMVEQVDNLHRNAKKLLEAFVVAREREARKAADEARRKLEEAERAAQQPQEDAFLAATAPDVKAVQAEARVAEMQANAASRVSSAAGGFNAAGLKTRRSAKVNDWLALAQHYIANVELRFCLQKLADADIRHAKGAAIELPGVEIAEERVL